jgi:hypothetical protein
VARRLSEMSERALQLAGYRSRTSNGPGQLEAFNNRVLQGSGSPNFSPSGHSRVLLEELALLNAKVLSQYSSLALFNQQDNL